MLSEAEASTWKPGRIAIEKYCHVDAASIEQAKKKRLFCSGCVMNWQHKKAKRSEKKCCGQNSTNRLWHKSRHGRKNNFCNTSDRTHWRFWVCLYNKWDKTGRERMKDFYLPSWNSSRTIFTHLEGEIKTWQTKQQPPHSPSRSALLFHMLLSLVSCSYSLHFICQNKNNFTLKTVPWRSTWTAAHTFMEIKNMHGNNKHIW